MEDLERIKDRLENIQSVEPIIVSLRTIAAGGWRQALARTQASTQYVEHVTEILALLAPQMDAATLARSHVHRGPQRARRALMLVIASERGLCGSFNEVVLKGAEQHIAQQQLQSDEVLVATLGKRAQAYFAAQGRELFMAYPLPVTRVASFDLVRNMGASLLGTLESGEVDAVYVIYSPYKAGVTQPPVSQRWMPIEASALPTRTEGWPVPIIETDRRVLFQRALREWTYAQLFQFVMESAASEQSARFRAMDSASNNLTRIIDELTLSYHTARQHAITMEMLDLVAGSGILRRPSGRDT
ncbi:MAG: hypothetical protein FJZ90_07085 [Chloroflexi bacterium]|nr:hypothetical protein [Chloroflexota bacterium]